MNVEKALETAGDTAETASVVSLPSCERVELPGVRTRSNVISLPGSSRFAVPSAARSAAPPSARSVRCVWTSHLQDGRSCGLHMPIEVVRAAWGRELERGRTREGFFHFSFRGEVWLGYGLPNGEVRGVYCPAHRAQREERLGYDPELAP